MGIVTQQPPKSKTPRANKITATEAEDKAKDEAKSNEVVEEGVDTKDMANESNT